jgi:transcriptional regulator with XRE-family HTH domain
MSGRDDDPSAPPSDPGAPDPPREDPALGEALGRAIKVIRTAQDVGRRDLAERAGLSYSYLAEIENGRKQASSSAQQAIASALGIPVSELIAAAEGMAEQIVEGRATSSGDALTIARSLAIEPLAFEDDAPRYSSSGARARQLRWMRGARNRPTSDFDAKLGDATSLRRSLPTSSSMDRSADTITDRTRSVSEPTDERGERPAQQLHAITIQLMELLGELSEEDRERVLDLARRLAGR